MDISTRCLCPGSPHADGDTITFVDKPDFRRAVAMQKSITILKGEQPDAGPEDVLAVLAEAYLVFGITSWTLVDQAGKPLEVNRASITARVLSEIDVAMTLADEVDDLYSEVILLPLLRRASSSSPDSQTTDGTSAPTGSSPTNPTPSSPSSISTIPTAAIGTTSTPRAGASKSSPRAESVA